jgi:glutathione S-transferase
LEQDSIALAGYFTGCTFLHFFEDTIADRPYFTGNTFTVADIVAGTLVPSASMFGISFCKVC